MSGSRLGDYVETTVSDDNAAPTLAALLRGDVHDAASSLPAMGGVSLLLRLPFAALAGGDVVWRYRLGVLACLLVAVALAAWVDARLRRDAATLARRICVGALLVASPAALAAIAMGHPEEILGGALCVAACLAAIEDRRVLAGLLLGLAVGTKQWALLAVLPVLLALGGGRMRTLAWAAGVSALFILPELLADPTRYMHVNRALGQGHRVYPQSLWWPLAQEHTGVVDIGGGESARIAAWSLPAGITRALTSALTLGLALATAAFWQRRPRPPLDALALLALLLLLRCALDPMNLEYYLAPALIALTAWDGRRTRGLPTTALAASALSLLAWHVARNASVDLQWVLWLTTTSAVAAIVLLRASPRRVELRLRTDVLAR